MSPYNPNVTQIQLTNSTTYADTLGLQLGLPRILGETADQYLKRLEFAANLTRTAPYPGAVNEINLRLGVTPAAYISLTLPDSVPTVVTISIAGITIGSNPIIPLLTFASDAVWEWKLLSDIVSSINSIPFVTATLLVDDGPALQLARQSNSLWSFSETVSGIQTTLKYTGIQVGTEMFNQPTSSYTLTESGSLIFESEPQLGTNITYNYIVNPYNLVGSPVALIGLTDPEFTSVAETRDGVLAYQVSEFVQNIMSTDLSYWGL